MSESDIDVLYFGVGNYIKTNNEVTKRMVDELKRIADLLEKLVEANKSES